MIKFFRQIRKNLLAGNRFSKYLLYAIGEIFLVVLGILIALQLNNWNEDRKKRILEVQILQEIRRDLEQTSMEVERDRNAHVHILARTDSLVDHLVDKRHYEPRITEWMISSVGNLQVYPKTSGYEALKSIGFNLLSNDSLRGAITDGHELVLRRVVEMGKQESESYSFSEELGPYLDKYLKSDLDQRRELQVLINEDSSRSATTFRVHIPDYANLLTDMRFIQALSRAQLVRRDYIRRHNWVRRELLDVIQAIDDELGKLRGSM